MNSREQLSEASAKAPPPDAADTPELALQALEQAGSDAPELAQVIPGLRGLVLARVALRGAAALPLAQGFAVDPARFAGGAAALPRQDMPVDSGAVASVAGLVLPALAAGLPAARAELAALERAAAKGDGLAPLASAWLKDDRKTVAEAAVALSVREEVLGAALAQVASGLAVRLRRAVVPHIEKLFWDKGCCPVCGSLPALSFLTGTEGRRRLWCSFCGHDWPFKRTMCPFCGNEDQHRLEFFRIEGRLGERAEACHACARWLPGVDARKLSRFLPEAALLRFLPMEMLLREKGLSGGNGFLDLAPGL